MELVEGAPLTPPLPFEPPPLPNQLPDGLKTFPGLPVVPPLPPLVGPHPGAYSM
ncbi:MAG: hypothetical protein KF852_16435 [Saprospiraceae bacterium]|nr:hypothetical protein [Saprospiraceae bacterium]